MRRRGALRLVSWNVQRPSFAGFLEVCRLADATLEWDALLLQEVAGAGGGQADWVVRVEAELGGHRVLWNEHKPHDTAVVLHRRWDGRLVSSSSSPWAVLVSLRGAAGVFSMGSVHLPDSSHPDHIYEEALAEVSAQLPAAGGITLGMDANAELAWEEGGATRDGNSYRAGLFADWLAAAGLQDCAQPAWTRRGAASRKRLDCIVSSAAAIGHCRAALEMHVRSDHRPLCLERAYRPDEVLTFEPRPPSMRGWRPVGSNEACRLDRELRSALLRPGVTCSEVQNALADTAAALTPWSRPIRGSGPPCAALGATWAGPSALERRVVEAEAAWQEASRAGDEEGRRRTGRRLWRRRLALARARRRERLQQLGTSGPTSRRAPRALCDSAGARQEDQARWGELITAHFANKFRREGWTEEGARMDLEFWESAARSNRLDGRPPRCLTFEEFLAARDRLRLAAAPGGDRVPPALLACLGPGTLHAIFGAFQDRLAGRPGHTAPIPDWLSVTMVAIPKKGNLERLSNWRPISLCSAVLKWYEACLWTLLEEACSPLPTCLVGFRSGRQCLDIVAGLQGLLAKASEWQFPLYVASMDIAAAFDNMRIDYLGASLSRRGAPAHLVAALLREHTGMSAVPCLGFVSGEPVLLQKGGRQGGSRTPVAWNHLLAESLAALRARWRSEGRAGLSWAPDLADWDLTVWADNFYLVCSNPVELQRRTFELEDLVGALGLHFGASSLELLSNPTAQALRPELPPPLALQSGAPFQEVDVLVALGIALDSHGSSAAMLAHRTREAQKCWNRCRALLVNKTIPADERMRAFGSTVGASLLYGAGLWRLGPGLLGDLGRTERRWLRQMAGVSWRDGELWQQWAHRAGLAGTRLRRLAGLPSLSARAAAAVHGWHGHAARSGETTFAGAVLRWRGSRWWRTVQAVAEGPLPPGEAHPRRSWPRNSAELPVYTWYDERGQVWEDVAQDRALWRAGGREFSTGIG